MPTSFLRTKLEGLRYFGSAQETLFGIDLRYSEINFVDEFLSVLLNPLFLVVAGHPVTLLFDLQSYCQLELMSNLSWTGC